MKTELTVKEIFDSIQSDCEHVLSMLRNREPGLISWNNMLAERFLSIQESFTELGMPLTKTTAGWKAGAK